MKVKERNRIKLLDYLSNPDNEYLNRKNLSVLVLGYKDPKKIYAHYNFTPDELDQIETEALELRRKKYKSRIARADNALLNKAMGGDVSAIKLCYQRFEDWCEKKRSELTGKDGKDLVNEVLITLVGAKDAD